MKLITEAIAISQYDKMGLLQYSTTLSSCLMEKHRLNPSKDDLEVPIKLSREVLGM
jgi:hypothetical protein